MVVLLADLAIGVSLFFEVFNDDDAVADLFAKRKSIITMCVLVK